MKKLVGTIVIILATLVLASCGDLTAFMGTLDDEVKIANDRYLEVVSVYPSQNSWFVNPGQDIQITFDRPVDISAVIDDIQIVDTIGNTFELDPEDLEFDVTTNTLTLKPNPYLEDSRQYSIILSTGMISSQMNPLRDEVSWSFTTGTYPKGYFLIHDNVADTGTAPGYTTSTTVPLEVVTSNADDYFLDDEDPNALNDAARSGLVWKALTGDIDDLSSHTDGYSYPELNGINGLAVELDPSPQGMRSIYMLFRDDGNTGVVNYTPLEVGKTFLDTVPPTPNPGSDTTPTRLAISRTAGPVDSGDTSGTGSGINPDSISWSAPGAVMVGSPNSRTSTFSGPASTEAVYTISLTVEDKAGNSTTDSFYLNWDTIPPSTPTVSSTATTPTTDHTPSWVWSYESSGNGISHFRRRLDGGSLYSDYDQSYTPSVNRITGVGLTDGKHTLEVSQYDEAGNLSSAGSSSVWVNTAGVSPYPDQTWVSLNTILNWPVKKGTTNYRYYIYKDGKTLTYVTSGSTGISSQSPAMSLNSLTGYTWRYEAWSGTTRIYASPYFDFTTRTFIIFP